MVRATRGIGGSLVMLERARDALEIAPALAWGLGGVVAALLLGSLAAWRPGGSAELRARMASWWVMVALVAGALLLGWAAVTALFAIVSFLALKELLSLAPLRREDRLVVLFAYLTVPFVYGLVALDRYTFFLIAVPVYFFITAPFLLALGGQTRGYLSAAAVFQWGVLTCVSNVAYIAFLMRTPDLEAPAGAAGLVFFLLLATEMNDVLQYVCGKLFGRRKIAPTVSPNKTWEGFLGGWALTAGLIVGLAPVFTPFSVLESLVVAGLLPVAGFAGDVTMSAIKRDLGVKDTSGFIPGHGGVLDRLDSLTFTAPLYFHLLAAYALDRF